MLPSHSICCGLILSRRDRIHTRRLPHLPLFQQIGGPVGRLQGIIQQTQLAGGFIRRLLQRGDLHRAEDLDLGAGGTAGVLAGFADQAAVGFRA